MFVINAPRFSITSPAWVSVYLPGLNPDHSALLPHSFLHTRIQKVSHPVKPATMFLGLHFQLLCSQCLSNYKSPITSNPSISYNCLIILCSLRRKWQAAYGISSFLFFKLKKILKYWSLWAIFVLGDSSHTQSFLSVAVRLYRPQFRGAH